MADDDISPIEPVGPARVPGVEPPVPPRPTAPPPAVGAAAAGEPVDDGGEVELAAPLQRADALGDDVAAPATRASVGTVLGDATVHDAAMHGSAYARAVEDADPAHDGVPRASRSLEPPLDAIERQLAGASAAAGLGTAARIDRTRYDGADEVGDDLIDAAGGAGQLRRVGRVEDDPAGDGDADAHRRGPGNS